MVSDSIADIFFSNALKNGLVPVRIDAATHGWLVANPGAVVEIDVAKSEVVLPDGRRSSFPLDPFAQHCLVHGIDELGYLLERLPEIEAWEAGAGSLSLVGPGDRASRMPEACLTNTSCRSGRRCTIASSSRSLIQGTINGEMK